MVLKKVTIGEPFKPSAELHNATVDAIHDHRARQRQFGVPPGTFHPQPGLVIIKNDTNSDLPRCSVLALDAPIFAPTDADPMDNATIDWWNRPAFSGVSSVANHRGKYAVILEPLRAGKIGVGMVSGVVNMTINVDATWHEGLELENGTTSYLKSRPYGTSKILWSEGGTGEQRGTVLLGSPGGYTSPWWGVLTATLSSSGSATATLTASGATVTVWDRFLGSGSLASGKGIGISYDPILDRLYVTEAVC